FRLGHIRDERDPALRRTLSWIEGQNSARRINSSQVIVLRMRTKWVCLVGAAGKRDRFSRAYQKDFIAEPYRFRNAPPAFGKMFQLSGVLNFHCSNRQLSFGHHLLRNRVEAASEFPNLFDLNLVESVARSFLASDCDNLRGVISKLVVYVGVLTRQ